MPFRFDDPSVYLFDYDEIWLFGDEGYDGGGPAGPQSGSSEPGRLSDSELAKITAFMQAGGVFAVGIRGCCCNQEGSIRRRILFRRDSNKYVELLSHVGCKLRR
jgi:hypothetical protein